jgi:pimeloyl-ACP methyl ester carboxylesterase
MDRFADLGIKIHYVDYPGSGPALMLLPGLTANAHSFDGLIKAGLNSRCRVLAPDLRGRGLSDKPATGYSMAEHAEDAVGVLDSLSIASVIVGGHSFGGLLAIYLASRYADRVSKLVLFDSSSRLVNPTSLQLIKPSLERLGKRFSSWQEYLELMKQAPSFDGWWDATIESYFRADVEVEADGSVRQRSRSESIFEAAEKAQLEDWSIHLAGINQPAILFHARGGYGPPGTPPLVPLEDALATAKGLSNCRYVEVPGNHFTMLYGEGADLIVNQIDRFAACGDASA